jgi:GTP-binding protein EngB required for normal cell division
MAPEYLRGYGELPDATASEIRGLCAELEGLIHSMERSLALGDGSDLAARVNRLTQTPSEADLIRLLDRITNEQDLAEFRSPLTGLVERLESPRFEIAFFGRVSSGKSSLLNRLLDTRVLPVGVNPITAVPTRIVFGNEPSFTASFVDRRTLRFPIDELVHYASEEFNPGNELGVIKLTVALPSPRLGNGLVLVDTPGLGALARAGAAETLSYLPQCDLGIVLVSAASPLNEEDLNTIQALIQAAIPAMVVLSKADLLSAEDRHKAAEYARDQIQNHLSLKIGVHPVSTMPAHEELLQAWFQQEVAPLFDRQQELALQSLRRKAGALREAVVVALKAKLEGGGNQASRTELEEAERDLRNTAGFIEEARRACIDRTDEMRFLDEETVRTAVSLFLREADLRGRYLSAGDLSDAAQSIAVSASQDLARLLTDLAERLQNALALAEKTLRPAEAPQIENLAQSIRELPRFEMALPQISFRPPWYLPLSGLRRAWLESRIQHSAGPNLQAAFNALSRSLAAWSASVLSELQNRFDQKADVYRAQLGRLIRNKRLDPVKQELVKKDLAELERWSGAYSGEESVSGRN